jgi:peptidoglycan/LPS O-acetylase OafA/YrhL
MERSRGIDVVALALSALLLVEGVLLALAQRSFALMFRDFGATLPLPTRLFIQPAFPIGVALVGGAFALEGVIRRRSEGALLARVISVLVLAAALLIGFFVAMYAPIFNTAGDIR